MVAEQKKLVLNIDGSTHFVEKSCVRVCSKMGFRK